MKTILYLYLLTIMTWLWYLAVMRLRQAKLEGALTGPAKFFGYQILFIGLILDTVFNWIIGTIVFLEIPREFLFTARCNRHIPSKTWRREVARFFCRELLDPFDKDGKHCRG